MIVYNCLFPEITDGLADRLKKLAPVFAAYGGSAILWPPLTQTDNPYSLGYDPKRDLDVGQWPGRPLRWGSAAEVLEANETMHQCGLLVMEDWVIHQYGGRAPLYEFGSDGQVDKELFPKMPSCFVPNVKTDNVFDAQGNAADGLMVSYQHSTPKGYMLNGKIQSGRWRHEVLGLDGWRGDEAKGEAVGTVKALAQALPGLIVAEVYTGDPGELETYVTETGLGVLDFGRHFAYRAVSEGASLRTLVDNGFCFRDSGHSFIYVESNDTDGPGGVVNNKLWFYLDALTMPAKAALIYAGDYERYGLAPFIRNQMWFASTFAIGKLTWEYQDDTLLAWSRDGNGGPIGWSGGCFCGFSSDPINHRTEWVHTPFPPGTRIHCYAGHGPDLTVNGDGWACFVFGPNAYGSAQNYVMYAPAGVQHEIPHPALPHRGTGAFTDFNAITVRYS